MGAALETAMDLEVDAPNGLAHVATPEEAKKHGWGIPSGKDLSAGFDAGRSPRASTAIDAVRQRAAMDPRAPSANDGATPGGMRSSAAMGGGPGGALESGIGSAVSIAEEDSRS